jgi:non-ribosomal peptide synthetase component F
MPRILHLGAYAPLKTGELKEQGRRAGLRCFVSNNAGVASDELPHREAKQHHLWGDFFFFTLDPTAAQSTASALPEAWSRTAGQPLRERESSEHGPTEHHHTLARTSLPSSASLAYVLTTSGTTRGVPSVVAVPHACVVPNIFDFARCLQIAPGDVLYLASPLSFDPSVVEIFSTLSSGATLLVGPHAVRQSPRLLASVLDRHRVSLLFCTPSMLSR